MSIERIVNLLFSKISLLKKYDLREKTIEMKNEKVKMSSKYGLLAKYRENDRKFL